MSKSPKILLLSDQEDEYNALVKKGVEEIIWVPSFLKAYDYYLNHEEELANFDLILLGSSTVHSIDTHPAMRFYYQTMSKYKVPYIVFFMSYYDKEEKFYVVHPDFVSPCYTDTFVNLIYSQLPVILKDLKINKINSPTVKNSYMPRFAKDVKILFMSAYDDHDKIRSCLEAMGFVNIDFIESNNFSLEKVLEDIPNYDIVVGDEMFNSRLISLDKEYHYYLEGTGRTIFLATYDLRSCFNVVSLKLETVSTNLKYEKEEKLNILANEEEALVWLLSILVNMYNEFNPLVDLPKLITIDELTEEADRRKKIYDEDYRMREHAKNVIKYLKEDLDDYCKYQEEGYNFPFSSKISIENGDNSKSVSYYEDNKEVFRITFVDDGYSSEYNCLKGFYIRCLDEYGNLGKPIPYGAYMNSYTLKEDDPEMVSEDIIKKIDLISDVIQKEYRHIFHKIEHPDEVEELPVKDDSNNKIKSLLKRFRIQK